MNKNHNLKLPFPFCDFFANVYWKCLIFTFQKRFQSTNTHFCSFLLNNKTMRSNSYSSYECNTIVSVNNFCGSNEQLVSFTSAQKQECRWKRNQKSILHLCWQWWCACEQNLYACKILIYIHIVCAYAIPHEVVRLYQCYRYMISFTRFSVRLYDISAMPTSKNMTNGLFWKFNKKKPGFHRMLVVFVSIHAKEQQQLCGYTQTETLNYIRRRLCRFLRLTCCKLWCCVCSIAHSVPVSPYMCCFSVTQSQRKAMSEFRIHLKYIIDVLHSH